MPLSLLSSVSLPQEQTRCSNRPIIWRGGAADKLHGSLALYILWAGLNGHDMLRMTAGRALCSTVRLFVPKNRAS